MGVDGGGGKLTKKKNIIKLGWKSVKQNRKLGGKYQ